MKIILFGLNVNTLKIAQCISHEHTVVGVTDYSSEISQFGWLKYIPYAKLREYNPDYVIVCNEGRQSIERIRNRICSDHGMNIDCVLGFFSLFFESRLDQIMLKARMDNVEYDGIVLGISHAEKGINPESLDGSWCNLAVTSEDIYYHNKVLKKLINEYPDRIKNIQKIIIDLYDYTIFDVDTSISGGALNYYGLGGYTEDWHSFAANKVFAGKDAETFLLDYNYFSSNYARENREIRRQLFDERKVFAAFEENQLTSPTCNFYKSFWDSKEAKTHISTTPMLEHDLYFVAREHPETRKENEEYLREMLETIRKYNPECAVYFVLLPRFEKVEAYHRILLKDYKEYFETVVGRLCDEYDVKLLNYKDNEKITKNNFYFMDPAHLNNVGATVMTSLINKDMAI